MVLPSRSLAPQRPDTTKPTWRTSQYSPASISGRMSRDQSQPGAWTILATVNPPSSTTCSSIPGRHSVSSGAVKLFRRSSAIGPLRFAQPYRLMTGSRSRRTARRLQLSADLDDAHGQLEAALERLQLDPLRLRVVEGA